MIENDAFKLLLINLFHLNPDDIANILCTTFNKMMVLVVTLAVDLEMKGFIKEAIIRKILNFDIKRF